VNRGHRPEIGHDRLDISIGHIPIHPDRPRGAQSAAILAFPVPNGPDDFRIRPRADAGLQIRSDVAGDGHTKGVFTDLLPSGQMPLMDRPLGSDGGVTIATGGEDLDEVLAALDSRLSLDLTESNTKSQKHHEPQWHFSLLPKSIAIETLPLPWPSSLLKLCRSMLPVSGAERWR